MITTLASEHRELIEAEDPDCWAALFEVPRPDASKTLLLWDNPTGIYKAFYLLIDGITCMLPNAVDPIQKSIGEAVMATLTQLIEAQGNPTLRYKRFFLLELAHFVFMLCVPG